MTDVGSAYGTVKAAIVTRLRARSGLSDVAIQPAPPTDPVSLMGESGSGKAIWIADAEGSYDAVVMAAPDLRLDETFELVVVCQSLPKDTDDDQLVTDLRVDALVFEVLHQAAQELTVSAPWGIPVDDDPFNYLQITPGTFERYAGPLTNQRPYPSRTEQRLQVESRLVFRGLS